MFSLLFVAALCASSVAMPVSVRYSYSLAVGSGGGSSFSSEGEGRITAVRVWEIQNSYITGIQLRYGLIWSQLLGRRYGTEKEIELFDKEVIIQISGKYHPSNYIYQLFFVTNFGRSLIIGQPNQISFNFYPSYPESELKLLSGRYNGNGITSLGAHWISQVNSTGSG